MFLIAILSLLGCNRNDDTNQNDGKFFNPENLNQLDLANIDDYWTEGIKIDTSFNMEGHFENHPGFIDGIRLYSQNGKAIWVTVFKSKDDAINAMESRINTVVCVITSGNPDELETQWWYSDCFDYRIFVNQYNTIVEIDFASNAPFDLIKEILIDVAKEVIVRIDLLSK